MNAQPGRIRALFLAYFEDRYPDFVTASLRLVAFKATQGVVNFCSFLSLIEAQLRHPRSDNNNFTFGLHFQHSLFSSF